MIQAIGEYKLFAFGWYTVRASECEIRVTDGKRFCAKLYKAFPGKWKIVGEDTYAKDPNDLVERLQLREMSCTV